MTQEEAITAFAKIISTARNSGINTLKKYIEGTRLKKPASDAEALYSLIDSLNDEQKDLLVQGIPFLLDISYFRLFYLLETTENPIKIELNVIDENGKKSALIDNENDLELRSKYFTWVK